MYAAALFSVFVASFLLGSIPWGLIVSRVHYKIDIREHGSGNIGATNAVRILGKVGGVAVFLLDFGKGMLSVLIAAFVYLEFVMVEPSGFVLFSMHIPTVDAQNMLASAFCGCTLGHVFSPWLKLKGGKGVAVGVGALFVALGWIPGVVELALFAIVVLATRYVSAGSIAAALLCPLFSLWVYWGNAYAILMCVIVTVLVIWAHRTNIKRLVNGTESRVGQKPGQLETK